MIKTYRMRQAASRGPAQPQTELAQAHPPALVIVIEIVTQEIVGVVRTHLPFVSKPSGSRPAQSWLACAARIEGAARLRSKACYKAGSLGWIYLFNKGMLSFKVQTNGINR